MTVLYEGMLNKDNQNLSFHVQVLSKSHLQSILFLQEQVIIHLTNKSSLSPLSKEEYENILDGNGLLIGAFVEDDLIALRALLVPPIDEEHLGKDIGLQENELSKVIYQEISCVHPAYRGNRLQKTLAALIMKELERQNHKYRYVCCTVAPFNIPSLKDKFAQGMKIAVLKEKYEGKLRYIFVKDLEEKEMSEWKKITTIPMEDTISQQTMLKEGWRGIKMEEMEGRLSVVYAI